MNAVRAFEAVARHQSISRAADELCVTHGAVSKQLKMLEEYLGAPLFERNPQGLTPTNVGKELAALVEPAFDALDDAFGKFADHDKIRHTCRLSTVPSFASQFLVPRLPEFRELYPNISLQILTTPRIVDFKYEKVDLAVRYGVGDWPNVECTPLNGSHLVAVCTPEILNKHELSGPEGILTSVPLIHKYSVSEWSNWLTKSGLGRPDAQAGLIFEDFNVAIKATLEGQGVCLLPKILVWGELQSGKLVKISDLELATEQKYHIVRPTDSREKPHCAEVAEWLRTETHALFGEAPTPHGASAEDS